MSFTVTLQSLNVDEDADLITQDYMELMVGDGTIGVVTGFSDSTFDETGFLSSPLPAVTYDNYDLDLLPENAIGIVVETFPYTRTFAANNNYISNYSTVSDFSEPSIIRSSRSDEFSYTVDYSTDEMDGLRDSYSGPLAIDTKSYVNDAINSLTTQAYRSSTTRQTIFKSIQGPRMSPRNMSSRSYLRRATQTTASAQITNNEMISTSTSQAGY